MTLKCFFSMQMFRPIFQATTCRKTPILTMRALILPFGLSVCFSSSMHFNWAGPNCQENIDNWINGFRIDQVWSGWSWTGRLVKTAACIVAWQQVYFLFPGIYIGQVLGEVFGLILENGVSESVHEFALLVLVFFRRNSDENMYYCGRGLGFWGWYFNNNQVVFM